VSRGIECKKSRTILTYYDIGLDIISTEACQTKFVVRPKTCGFCLQFIVLWETLVAWFKSNLLL